MENIYLRKANMNTSVESAEILAKIQKNMINTKAKDDKKHIPQNNSNLDNNNSIRFLDLKGFKVENVESIDGMLNGLSQLDILDISNFNLENVDCIYAFFNFII